MEDDEEADHLNDDSEGGEFNENLDIIKEEDDDHEDEVKKKQRKMKQMEEERQNAELARLEE